jgi:hypothetical protein
MSKKEITVDEKFRKVWDALHDNFEDILPQINDLANYDRDKIKSAFMIAVCGTRQMNDKVDDVVGEDEMVHLMMWLDDIFDKVVMLNTLFLLMCTFTHDGEQIGAAATDFCLDFGDAMGMNKE